MAEGAMGPSLTTVVFVDVVGSTALLQQVGDQAGLASVATQLERVRERVAEYGGELVKSTGDGYLLTFASPRQAVSFAVSAQRATLGSAPPIRFGINTGEVVAPDGDPMGGAVNAASRIADRAAGGEVLVSDVVRQLVGSAPGLRFVDRGRWRLKGFADRWRLWAAEDTARGPGTPVTVGRVAELGSIMTLVSSVTAGSGRVLCFEGEAGIGKTHLVRETVSRARQAGCEVVEIMADELVRRPWVVPRGLLESTAGDRAMRARLDELLDPTRPPVHVGEDVSYAIIEASVDVLEEVSAIRPVLLAVEDLQWADDLSIATLAAVARRVGVSRFALVTSLRPTPRSPTLDRLIDRVRDDDGTHVRLESLDENDTQALVGALIGATLGDGLRRRLRATAGNPLYITELVRTLDEGGLLRIDSGIAEVTGDATPTSLHETLVRRLSTLPPETNELLRLASLLGSSFTLHDLAAIRAQSVVEVAAGLREASRAGLITGAGDHLAFRHDLIREAVYEHMLPAERRELHRAAGQALAGSGAPTQQVAQQFARGALAGDREAVEWLERAAIEAVPISSNGAVELLQQALRLASEPGPIRHNLQARLIEPLGQCGRYGEAEEVARSILSSEPSPEVEYTARRGLAIVIGSRGDVHQSIDALIEAAAAAGASRTEAQQLRCVAAYLSMLLGSSSVAATENVADETLAVGAAEDDAYCRYHGHQTHGVIATVTGHTLESLDHLDAAVALVHSGRVTRGTYLNAEMFRVLSLVELDELDQAHAGADKIRHLAERTGSVVMLPGAYLFAGGARFFAGRWDEALAQFEAGRAIIEEAGIDFFALYYDAFMAKIAIRRGHLDDAERALALGTKRFNDRGSPFGADWLFDTQAELLAATGEHEAALNLARAVWEQTAHIRYFYGYRGRGVNLVHVALATGHRDLASLVTDALEEAARRTPTRSASRVALRCRGLVDEDPELILEAVAQHRLTPVRPELAACCEDAAGVLVAAGRRNEAVSLLREAASIHAELDTAGDATRVDATLTALGERTETARAGRPSHGWDSLTPTEAGVSRLVAQGLTNAAIGARLDVSRRTVETHLSHVFRKLRLASRTQLAAEIARREPAP